MIIPKYNNFKQERQVGEYTIYLPDPPDISKIAYGNLPKEQQFFRRTYLPDNWKLLPIEDRRSFANEQWDIRGREGQKGNGFWFWNNGNIEWMSPTHHFYCNWWRIGRVRIPSDYICDKRDIFYPFFTDADRDWFYLSDDCFWDEKCGGLFTIEFRRGGKALDIRTEIPTPNGWKTMQDIQEGDFVFGSDGKPTKVTFASPVMLTNDCYKITFSDKSEVIADADHLWIVHNKTARQNIKLGRPINTQVKKTSELIEKLKIYPKHKNGESNWSVENCKPIEYDKKELKIPPYIMGLWLGDGCSYHTGLTNIDEDIINEWKNYGKSIGLDCSVLEDDITYKLVNQVGESKDHDIQYKINPLREKLRHYNLFKNKHIPIDYLQSTIEDRVELLRGLMDTDGCIKSGYSTGLSCCEFCSKDKIFIIQVKELICSLGMKATQTEKYNKKYQKTYYYVRFSPNVINPFKLKRKAEKVKLEHTGGWRKNHRYIVSIEKVDSIPVKCISVDNADSSYLFGKDFIVTHNTYRAGCYQYEKVSKTHNAQGGTQSRDDSDSYNVFEKIIYGWRNLPPFYKPVDIGNNNPKQELVFDEPQKINRKQGEKNYSDILHSWINFGNASEGYYDGKEQIINIQDEIGKIAEKRNVNLLERIKVVVECCFIMGQKVGIVLGTTTVEEMEKAGGRQARGLWIRCTPSDIEAAQNPSIFPTGKAINELGETQSKLRRYFRPSYYGFLGSDDGKCFVDRYGYSRKEEAREYFLKKRRNKAGADLASEKRKFPLEIKDCWTSDVNQAFYDTMRLEQQFEHNNSYVIEGRDLIRGNFAWAQGIKDSSVEWQPDPKGRWLIGWLQEKELRNKKIMRHGRIAPGNTDGGAFGLDPYDNKSVTEDSKSRKSDAAAYGGRRFDPLKPYETGIPIAEYINRPPTPEIMWEDMIMVCVFYGWEILIENNKTGTINWFRQRGYHNYMMVRPDETSSDPTKIKDEDFGVPMSGEDARMALIYGIESFIYNKVGLIEEEGKAPYMGKMMFNNCIVQLIEYSIEEKWTKYDRMVALGLMLLAIKNHMRKKTPRVPTQFFPVYNTKTHKPVHVNETTNGGVPAMDLRNFGKFNKGM